MESKFSPNIEEIIKTLIDDKHRIRSEIESLRKTTDKKDSQINSLISLLTELNTDRIIKSEQAKVSSLLSSTPALPAAPVDNKKLESCKQKLKTHRKAMAKLAQNIKVELDVFQTCLLADIETIQSKFPITPKKTILISEVSHEPSSPKEESNNLSEEIEIGRIHFEGIKKKLRKK